jgi:hypothetical protein
MSGRDDVSIEQVMHAPSLDRPTLAVGQIDKRVVGRVVGRGQDDAIDAVCSSGPTHHLGEHRFAEQWKKDLAW